MAGPLREIDGGYAVRDNTRMYTVPGSGYVPAESRGPIPHRVDVTDSPLGYVPFVGDALQGWQAKIDYDEGDYLSAGMGAGLLMAPPFVSKVLKKTKPVWGPWARKVLVSGMDRVSGLSPRVRAFLDKYVSGVESDLSKVDIEGIRKSVIDYQKRRDLEKAPLIPGIENDLARYRVASTIPVVPATNRENILNRLGLTESTSGLMRAGAVNDGRRISIFPGNVNPGVVGHELRHSIQDEFTGATLPVPSGHTVIGGYRVPKYDFIPLERLPLEDNPALGEVRSILKVYNPESPWHQKITELDAEVERARQLYHPNTSWKELYDMGDERLDKSLDYLRGRFHLQNNDESNYLMKTLYENGYACGGKKYPDGGKFFRTDLGQESPMMYEPMMPVYPDVQTPMRYYPQPNLGDYEYPASTGMVQGMPIQTGYVAPVPETGVLQEEALVPVEIPTLDARKDAARRIMSVENSKANANGGWDAKTGRWYPHKSHEGGADTIAYGIKLSNGTPEAALALKQGYLTDQQAEHFVDTLVNRYYDAAKRVYDKKYGEGEWDKLSDKSQSILVDYSYNPGLAKFPKLMEGFHSGNMDLIRQNYKRYVNGKELGRNKTLLEEIDTLGNEYSIFRANGGKVRKGNNDFKSVKQRDDFVPSKLTKWIQDKIGPLMYPNPTGIHGDFSRMYFGRPLEDDTLYLSHYKPTLSKNDDSVYYAVKQPEFLMDLVTLYNDSDKLQKSGDKVLLDGYSARTASDKDDRYVGRNIERTYPAGDLPRGYYGDNYFLSDSVSALGNFTVSRGKDDSGEYLSYYDLWDVRPDVSHKAETRGIAKPYELYDRIYGKFDEDGVFHPDGEIMPAIIAANREASGGKIHIAPSKRGTFTAAAKKHGKSVQAFASQVLAHKDKYSPAMVKKANFARNAARWHSEGGILERYDADSIRQAIQNIR